jgi:hypothetical protein
MPFVDVETNDVGVSFGETRGVLKFETAQLIQHFVTQRCRAENNESAHLAFGIVARSPLLLAQIMLSSCENTLRESYLGTEANGGHQRAQPFPTVTVWSLERGNHEKPWSQVAVADDVGEESNFARGVMGSLRFAFVDDDRMGAGALSPETPLWAELDAVWPKLEPGGQLLVCSVLAGSPRRRVLQEWNRCLCSCCVSRCDCL